jgi:hypothetical protein
MNEAEPGDQHPGADEGSASAGAPTQLQIKVGVHPESGFAPTDGTLETRHHDGDLESHIKLLHELASPYAGRGKLILTCYGEDPDTGKAIPSAIGDYEIGDDAQMIKDAQELISIPHGNVYVPLAVMRPDLPSGKKGGENDIVAVLGLVADFDDRDAAAYATRLPLPPNYVLETSAGRYQAFYFFDRPATLNEAKPLGQALKEYARCDSGTGDMSHVWRVPGALNWPNRKKVVEQGRPRAPQRVKVAVPFDGAL